MVASVLLHVHDGDVGFQCWVVMLVMLVILDGDGSEFRRKGGIGGMPQGPDGKPYRNQISVDSTTAQTICFIPH